LQQTLDGVTAAQAAADSNKSVEDGMSAAASAEQNFQSAQETLSQILDQGPATNADTSADLGDAVHSILKASMVLSLKNAVEEALQETQKLRAAQAAWTAADKIENVVTRMVAKTKALEQINVEKQLLLFKILNVLDAREKLQSETMAQTPLGGNSSSPLNTPIHQ
jgi:hypothetical protein